MKKKILILILTLFLTACNMSIDKNETTDVFSETETTEASTTSEEQTQQVTTEQATTEQIEQTTTQTTEQTTEQYEPLEDEYRIDEIPVTRALAAKMLAYIDCDKQTILTFDREITFDDTEAGDWYDRFINASVIMNYINGTSTSFRPNDYLTVNEAQILMDRINKDSNLKIKVTEQNKNTPVSYALWVELFNNVLESGAGEKSVKEQYGIANKDLVILATKRNNQNLDQWAVITDNGSYTCFGINLDAYIDKKIGVQIKGNEILSLKTVEDNEPEITNCYITGVTDNAVSIFVGGANRTYEASGVTAAKGDIADVKINKNTIVSINTHTQKTSGIIKRVDDVIELEKSETLLAEDFKVYSITGENISWKTKNSLIVGTDIAEFTIKGDQICAAVINKKAAPENIRVTISDSISGMLFKEVSLTCSSDFEVQSKISDFSKQYKAGEVFSISENDIDFSRLYVTPLSADGRIKITSIKKQDINPSYRGIIEIGKQSGAYTIVNEVSLEEYLYAVVPSEMPTSSGLVASMVQAVTARSYAYNQFYESRYSSYGGNVNDTVACQVYNNVPENSNSIEAVDSTAGLCLTYGGSVISANFFSTSAGTTTNSGEVWGSGTPLMFPTETPKYLTGKPQYSGADFGDLTIESNAEKFFKAYDIDSYDKNFSWFRWNVTMTAEELKAAIDKNINLRYNAAKSMVKTLVDNKYLSRDISTVGEVVDLIVTKRGEGGIIMEMIIVGTENTVRVQTELSIRSILRPMQYLENSSDILLNLSNGNSLANYSILPSAFFVIDKTLDDKGNIASVTFFGGGNGHGVGMSQNGVKGMVDAGFDFEAILKHYYDGTEIKKMY